MKAATGLIKQIEAMQEKARQRREAQIAAPRSPASPPSMSAELADDRLKAETPHMSMPVNRSGEQEHKPEPPHSNVVRLPLWPDAARGVSNFALRSALFSAIQGKDRQALKRELLASVDGVEIRFSGWQLDQADLDVWEAILHLSRLQPLGKRVEFNSRALLKELGRHTGKSDRLWLDDTVIRLAGAVVEATSDGFTYFGTLLKGGRDEVTGRYVVMLDPKLLALYDAGWTQIEWSGRDALKRKPLAQWLHGWYCSHAQPYPVKVETLHRLSGSRNSQLSSFRRQLCKALDEVKEVGIIESWELRGDLVFAERNPTAAQRRHLARKVDKQPIQES